MGHFSSFKSSIERREENEIPSLPESCSSSNSTATITTSPEPKQRSDKQMAEDMIDDLFDQGIDAKHPIWKVLGISKSEYMLNRFE